MLKKTILLALPGLLLLAGCASDLKLSAMEPELKGMTMTGAAVVQLKGSRYPMHHNIIALRGMDFPSMCMTALEKALAKKRKNWKIIPPSTVSAADPEIGEVIPSDQAQFKSLAEYGATRMAKLAKVMETRYFLVIESIAVKDVSTPQAPANLVVGSCLQMWDFEKGRLLYRARSVSRPVNYAETDFDRKLEPALDDLFRELISPLPK
jgi:hypothetical protein